MSLYYWLIVVTALPCGYFAQTLKQTVPSITKNVGKIAQFKCEVEGITVSDNYPLHWYQQKPGQAPTRILYYGSGTTRDPGFGDRFKAWNFNKNGFSLRIEKLQKEDTATYYCAYWLYTHCAASAQYGRLGECFSQTPMSYVSKLGRSVRFKCTLDSGSTVVHWYQHREGQAPSRIFYYDGKVNPDGGFGSRFKADKQNTVCTLIINDIVKEDAATYYCAYWDSTVFNRDRNA
ncbi:uncharacterized protein LOC132815181 [Hemiscyllium ocellatum]|uniref:uncharacterized protein LOC132815181 n=1 Tax=Hemiscyllium ocellatum TaxID=170820 RepID=UPI002965D06A|nr:uncharacterized protein LOC132815181 [Hemiscyllium ocellatum]